MSLLSAEDSSLFLCQPAARIWSACYGSHLITSLHFCATSVT